MPLKEILQRAAREKWAVPHFNFSNLEILKAIAEAARETKSPVMAGTSEGEREFLGLSEAVALVKSFRGEGIMIFLNADHTKSVDAAKEAVDAGYDSVHIDLSAKSFEENVGGTAEVAKYARAKSPDISVEGELGYLRGESQVRKKNGVDRFAGAVGNVHGISLEEPAVEIEKIKKIRAAAPPEVALVLHAGS